jgi:hypothetical protein
VFAPHLPHAEKNIGPTIGPMMAGDVCGLAPKRAALPGQ